jgi:hypothetical protein
VSQRNVGMIAPSLKVDTSIALVGSSGSLKGSKLGKEIDSFKDVVRFNRAPTEGWERDVGSKTTIRILNIPTFKSAPLLRWKDDQFFTKKLKNIKIIVPGATRELLKKRDQFVDKSNTVYLAASPNIITSARKKFKGHVRTPTVGFITIAVLILAGLKPKLYGFDLKPGRPRDHYWHERPPTSVMHDFSEEAQILSRWAKEGKLVVKG